MHWIAEEVSKQQENEGSYYDHLRHLCILRYFGKVVDDKTKMDGSELVAGVVFNKNSKWSYKARKIRQRGDSYQKYKKISRTSSRESHESV